MYLVHVQLRPLGNAVFPQDAERLVKGYERPDLSVQHVAAHPDGPAGPVLGIFILAVSAEEAEHHAAELCRHALRECPELRGFSLERCETALLFPDH